MSVGEANSAYWRHCLGQRVSIFTFYYSVDNDFSQKQCREASADRESFLRELGLDPGQSVIIHNQKLEDPNERVALICHLKPL